MKKLMLTVAIVCAAVISQAASVDWQLSNKNAIMTSSGTAAKGFAVYALWTGADGYSDTIAGLATGSVNAGNIAGAAGYLGTATTGTTSAKAGKTDKATASSSSFVAGSAYSLVFVAFDTKDEKNYYYLSGTTTGKAYDGSAEYPTGTTAAWTASDYSSSNWHAVPEPTSGILVLLGMAGLALRRRRA